jgi:hypothetical protein
MVNVFISDRAALPPRRISFHAIHNIALHTSAPKPQSQVKLLLVFPFRSCAERDSTSLDPSSRRLFVSHRRNQKVFDVIIGIDLLIAVAITIRWLPIKTAITIFPPTAGRCIDPGMARKTHLRGRQVLARDRHIDDVRREIETLKNRVSDLEHRI